MLRSILLTVYVLIVGAASAVAQGNPQATVIMATACDFPLEPTGDATNPIPIGDGRFYYVTGSQLDELMADAFDFESKCDWEKAAHLAYDYQPTVQPEPVVAAPQPVPSAPTPTASKTYSPTRQARIDKNRELIRTCGFLSVPTEERDIEMQVGDGTVYYVSYTEQKGITNPLSGFKPCPEAEQDPAVFASMDKAARNNGMMQSRDTLNELGISTPPQSEPTTPAIQSAAAPAQPAQNTDLDAQLNEIIAADSNSWLFWRYDYGTTRNSRIEQNSGDGSYTLYGEYSFNGGRAGWVRVRFDDDQVRCIEFWNEGRCRGFRSPPSHGLLMGLVAGAAAGSTQGSSPSTSTTTQESCPWVTESIPNPTGGPDRMRTVQRC